MHFIHPVKVERPEDKCSRIKHILPKTNTKQQKHYVVLS